MTYVAKSILSTLSTYTKNCDVTTHPHPQSATSPLRTMTCLKMHLGAEHALIPLVTPQPPTTNGLPTLALSALIFRRFESYVYWPRNFHMTFLIALVSLARYHELLPNRSYVLSPL